MRLISDFPWYFLLLCLAAGAAYSVALYFLGRRTDSMPPALLWGLAGLRMMCVALIAFLLMAPLVKRTVTQKERPILLVAQDNSQSIALAGDSLDLSPLLRELRKEYDVRCYTFGESLQEGERADYQESCTDMASALTELRGRYEGRNVGGLILASDGLFNRGLNPLHCLDALPYPLYAVAQGDTTVRRDAAIAHTRYNRIAYLGNQFPLEVTVAASRLKGQQRTLTVSKDGKVLFSKPISYTSDDFSSTEQLLLTADRAGLQRYTVRLAPCPEEASTQNNERTLTIEVIDGHQRVAVVAAAPHPDVAALCRSLEENQNYEVTSCLAAEFKERPSDYDLLILHNLPAQGLPTPAWISPLPKGVPILFILGMQSDLSRFNNLHLGLEINSRIRKFNECTPLANPAFSLFTLSDDLRSRLEHFPPLACPFGDYRTAPHTQVLLTARLGNLSTGLPMAAFAQKGAVRYGFLCGEGLWRWRMADYAANQSFEAFNTLINKMVVYTSMKADKERFHVEARALYRAGETVTLEAALYNDNYELVNDPEVELSLTPGGRFLFNRSGTGYSLNLGTLAPGQYRFTATTSLHGQKFSSQGSFSVEELQLEDLTLVADHTLLRTMAQRTGGQLLSPSAALDSLPQLLRQRGDIRHLLYSHTRYVELLRLPWLFLLIVTLLGIEWIVRKYHGEI